jgi:Fe2+ or Zn2+ uptake regulation protein
VLVSEALRRHGLRLTNPRRLILEVVRATDVHPTALWVHRQVRRKLPRVSLGTVYRNLRILAGEGLLKEMADGRGLGRFDGNVSDHHHLTCSSCGRISDLAAPLDRSLESRVASRTGFEILRHRIEFYGRCPACVQTRRRVRVRGKG